MITVFEEQPLKLAEGRSVINKATLSRKLIFYTKCRMYLVFAIGLNKIILDMCVVGLQTC